MTFYLLYYTIFLLSCAACITATPQPSPSADLVARQILGCFFCLKACTPTVSTTSTLFVSATSCSTTATATITTTKAVSTVTRTDVSTVTQLATSTRTSTVTKISTTTATTTSITLIPTTVTATRLVPTTTTTTATSTIRVTGPRTTTSTITITRTCGAVSPTPDVAFTRTQNFDQFTMTEAGSSYPAVPTDDPSTFGLKFNGFVVYKDKDIPTPPSAPISAAILVWQDVNISSENTFTLISFRVYCLPESACNITLRAFSTDTNGNRQQSGSGWFTVLNADSFVLATMDTGSLGGVAGDFVGINQVQFEGAFAGQPEVAWIDDVVFSTGSTT